MDNFVIGKQNGLCCVSSSHVRAVVATLGGQQGVAGKADKWRHLYAGFTVWLSQTEAIGIFVICY